MAKEARAAAKDVNGSMVGAIEPNPEMNTVDDLVTRAGLNLEPGEPVKTYEILKSRDENRLEVPE